MFLLRLLLCLSRYFCIINESPISLSRLHIGRLFACAANIPLDSASRAVVYRAVLVRLQLYFHRLLIDLRQIVVKAGVLLLLSPL